MHDEVRVRNAGVDFLDALDREDVARGRARELVSPMARTDGNRECVDIRRLYEACGQDRSGACRG